VSITIIKSTIAKFDNLADFEKYSGLDVEGLRKLLDNGSVMCGGEYVSLYDISGLKDFEIAKVERITHRGAVLARRKLLVKLKKKMSGKL
jgi:hypothetical protein